MGIETVPPKSPAGTPPARSRILRWISSWPNPWVALVSLFLVWILSGPARSPAVGHLGLFLSAVCFLVAALALKRSAARSDLSHGVRRALLWISASQGLGSAGALYEFFIHYAFPEDKARFDLGDLFFLSVYPAVLAGLLSIPRSETRPVSRARILIDGAVFLAGVGLPLWYFTVLPGLANASPFDACMFVAYPVASFAGISVLNFVVLTRAPLPSKAAFVLLVSGICVSWLSDLIYLLNSSNVGAVPGPVDWSNVSSAVSIILILLSAGMIRSGEGAPTQSQRLAASSPLPIVTLVAVSAWLVTSVGRGRPSPWAVEGILSFLGLLFVILVIRELFVYRDHARLLASEVDRESRARFEVLVRNSSDMIMLLDGAGVVRFASSAVQGALSLSPAEMEGQTLLRLAHPEDASQGARFFELVGASSTETQSLRWRLRRADGTYRCFDTVGRNVVGESSITGMVVTSRDVTEQVTLEERLRGSEKLEALGQLVGGIAHNFNNILTSTIMRLGFLKERGRLPEDVLEEIDGLDREAARSAELTHKLVLFGQQQHLQLEPVDLRGEIQQLQPRVQRLLGKSVQLYLTGGASPQVVLADRDLIEYIVVSICSNARDAMPNGGCLIIEVADVEASPPEAYPGKPTGYRPTARLSFQDTGIGMDSSVVKRLFEPFFTTKGVAGVLGLGLASVHGVVRQHRGWITVESSPGLGSTFRVFLPKAAPAPGA